MNVTEVMKTLESMGTEQNRKIYARHGAGPPFFGVSFANLGALTKKIRIDHALAEALWATGNLDARQLATMIADPAAMSAKDLDRWAKAVTYFMNLFGVAEVAAASPHARRCADAWRASQKEMLGALGWSVASRWCLKDEAADEAWCAACVDEIVAGIHAAPNRKKEAMNQALIALGGRSEALRKKCVAAAKKIGKVEVDHGDTSCKTPDAVPYIEKTWAYAKSKGFASPAAQEQARRRGLGSCRR